MYCRRIWTHTAPLPRQTQFPDMARRKSGKFHDHILSLFNDKLQNNYRNKPITTSVFCQDSYIILSLSAKLQSVRNSINFPPKRRQKSRNLSFLAAK